MILAAGSRTSKEIRRLRREMNAARRAYRRDPKNPAVVEAFGAAQQAYAKANPSRLELRAKAFLDSLGQPTKAADGSDLRDVWHPLSRRERLLLAPVVMDLLFFVTFYTGWRDRMRCPRCTAVGTWKMHGTWWERWRYGDIHLRRWGCKWCGHWIASGKGEFAEFHGRTVAWPREKPAVWGYPDPTLGRNPTPAEAVHERMGRTWPWRG